MTTRQSTRNNRISGVQSNSVNPTRNNNHSGDETTMTSATLQYNDINFTFEYLGTQPTWNTTGHNNFTWFALSKEIAHYSCKEFRSELVKILGCRYSGTHKAWGIKNGAISPDEIIDAMIECGATVEDMDQPEIEPVKTQPKAKSSKVETHKDTTVKAPAQPDNISAAKREIEPSKPLVSSGGIVLSPVAKTAIEQIAQINVLAVLKMTAKLERDNGNRSSVMSAIANRMLELLDAPEQTVQQSTPVAPTQQSTPKTQPESKPVQSTLSPEVKAKVEQIRQNATIQQSVQSTQPAPKTTGKTSGKAQSTYQPNVKGKMRFCDSCNQRIPMIGGTCKQCSHVNPSISWNNAQPVQSAQSTPKTQPESKPVQNNSAPVAPSKSEIDELRAMIANMADSIKKLSALVLAE